MGELAGFSYGDTEHQTFLLAHELASPLILIRQLAAELEADELTASQRAVIARQIRLVSDKSLRLSTSFTTAASAQQTLFPTEALQILPVLDQVTRDIRPLYQAHGHSLSRRRHQAVPQVVANRELLSKILSSFVDSALAYNDSSMNVELFTQYKKSTASVRVGVKGHTHLPVAFKQSIADVAEYRHSLVGAGVFSSNLALMIAGRLALYMGSEIGAVRHRSGMSSLYIDLPLSQQMSLL